MTHWRSQATGNFQGKLVKVSANRLRYGEHRHQQR